MSSRLQSLKGLPTFVFVFFIPTRPLNFQTLFASVNTQFDFTNIRSSLFLPSYPLTLIYFPYLPTQFHL